MQRNVGEEPPYTKFSSSGLDFHQDQDDMRWNSFPNASNPEDDAFPPTDTEQFSQTDSNLRVRRFDSKTDVGISSGFLVSSGKKYSSLIDYLSSMPAKDVDTCSPLLRLREIIISSISLKHNQNNYYDIRQKAKLTILANSKSKENYQNKSGD